VISFNPVKFRWPRSEHFEVVTRAPRKLFALLTDAVDAAGFTRISSNSLRVVGETVAGTGTMRGRLLAETPPKDILLPWRALRITGWTMIIIGVLLLLREVAVYLETDVINYYLFLLAISLCLLGARLPGLNRFSSEFVWIDIRGEAFPSPPGEGAPEVPGTLPVVCDLRMGIRGAAALSRNGVTRRKLLYVSDSAQISEDFDRVVDAVTGRVLPLVRVRGKVGVVQEEPPPPPPED
jgi:uncharacterized protein YjeT (DUF2065 family)